MLWGRHFPRGGLLKGKPSTGEEVKTDRAFLGATNGDIGLLWSICDGDVLLMVDGGGAILEHQALNIFHDQVTSGPGYISADHVNYYVPCTFYLFSASWLQI